MTATLAILLLAIGLMGCGEDKKDFATPTYPFTFEYPEGWKTTRDVALEFGAPNAERQLAVQLAAPYDQMVISQYKLKKSLPEGIIANQKEIDRIVGSLSKQSGGVASNAERVSVGGLEGYSYVIDFERGNVALRNELIFLFRDRDEFQLTCQSSEKRREQTQKGCDQIKETLKFN